MFAIYQGLLARLPSMFASIQSEICLSMRVKNVGLVSPQTLEPELTTAPCSHTPLFLVRRGPPLSPLHTEEFFSAPAAHTWLACTSTCHLAPQSRRLIIST